MLNQDGLLLSLPGDAVDSTLPQRSLSPPKWKATEIKRIEIQTPPEFENPCYLKIYSNGALELIETGQTMVFSISFIENRYYIHPEIDLLEQSVNFLFISLLALSRYIARYHTVDEADLGFTNINQAMAAVERLEITSTALSQAQDEIARQDTALSQAQDEIARQEAIIKELENRLKAAEEELHFRREEDGIFHLELNETTDLELEDDTETLQD